MSNDTELGTLLSTRATDLVDHLDLPADLLGTVRSAHGRHRRDRIVGTALGVAVLIAGVGIGAASLSDAGKQSKVQIANHQQIYYHNARFGFSDKVPANFVLNSVPEDRDGLSWHSRDGQATFTVSGSNNVNGLTPAADLTGNRQRYQGPGGTITAQSENGPVVMVTGTVDRQVFYQRDVVLSRAIYTIEWSYPVADKARYDPLVTSTVDSFRPGPNHTA